MEARKGRNIALRPWFRCPEPANWCKPRLLVFAPITVLAGQKDELELLLSEASKTPLLDRVHVPRDLKNLSAEQLKQLADELRY